MQLILRLERKLHRSQADALAKAAASSDVETFHRLHIHTLT